MTLRLNTTDEQYLNELFYKSRFNLLVIDGYNFCHVNNQIKRKATLSHDNFKYSNVIFYRMVAVMFSV